MRLLILLTFLATLLTSVLAAATDTSVCRSSQRNGKNNFDIVQAINNFCGPTWDLTVPSPKALIGATSNNRKITVLINGSSCGGRPAWVPRKYCISQFYRVCASSVKGGRGGNGVLGFGSKKCQKFTIANGPY